MITLNMKEIEELFDKYDNQYDVLIAIYKVVFPDWDDIEAVSGSPSVSPKTWQDICGMFIEFDKVHHPTVLAGGCWLNRGFDSLSKAEDGTVDISSLEIEYKEALCENSKSG